MFVLEVNSLIDVLGEAEYLIAGVDHILILDEMVECVDIWCAIEQNSSSVGFEVGVGLALAAGVPGVLQFYDFFLLGAEADCFLLPLDESLKIVLDVGEFGLHVRV